jgi:hypothetical protein
MPNAYANLADFKGSLVAGVDITTHDARMRELLEAVSRVIDEYLGRHMYSQTATRYFTGNGLACIKLPWDLIAVTTLKEDTTDNATYDTTWGTADYILVGVPGDPSRYDHAPTGRAYLVNTKPYEAIEVDTRSTGSKSNFPINQRNFELVGKFGYSESTLTAVSLVDDADFTATELTFTVDDGTEFSIGQTILIDSEQMYITAIATNLLTVQRAINGTTGATHANNAAISIIEYPEPIREAVLLEAGLLMETRGYRRQLGNFETGIITPFGRTLSAETRSKIDPFRLWPI